MTKDNDRPGFLARNVTLVADDGIGVLALVTLARKLYGDTDGYMLGVLTDTEGETVNIIGHQSTSLVVTVEANPRIIRMER